MGKLGVTVAAAFALILSGRRQPARRRASRTRRSDDHDPGRRALPLRIRCALGGISHDHDLHQLGWKPRPLHDPSHQLAHHLHESRQRESAACHLVGPSDRGGASGRQGTRPDSRQRPTHRREGRRPDLHRQRTDRLHRAGHSELGRATRGAPRRRADAARARISSQLSAARSPDTCPSRGPCLGGAPDEVDAASSRVGDEAVLRLRPTGALGSCRRRACWQKGGGVEIRPYRVGAPALGELATATWRCRRSGCRARELRAFLFEAASGRPTVVEQSLRRRLALRHIGNWKRRDHEASDAGSIPAASTFPANGDLRLQLVGAPLLKLEEGLR